MFTVILLKNLLHFICFIFYIYIFSFHFFLLFFPILSQVISFFIYFYYFICFLFDFLYSILLYFIFYYVILYKFFSSLFTEIPAKKPPTSTSTPVTFTPCYISTLKTCLTYTRVPSTSFTLYAICLYRAPLQCHVMSRSALLAKGVNTEYLHFAFALNKNKHKSKK